MHAGPVVELLVKYENAFNPRLFVVKNYKFKRLVGLSAVFPEQILHSSRNKTAAQMLSAVAEAKAGGRAAGSQPTCRPASSLAAPLACNGDGGQQCGDMGQRARPQHAWRVAGLHLLALTAAFACGAAFAHMRHRVVSAS